MRFLIVFPDWGYFPLTYRRRIPPLSPATLAGVLCNWGEVFYIDERLEPIPKNTDYDVVFISAMTNQVHRAYHIADHFRSLGTTVVIGGVHASLLPAEAAQHADTVFIGEAEDTLRQFINDFSRGKILTEYQCQILENAPSDRYPPDRSIYPGKGYLPLDPIQFFKGCRLSCEACSVPQLQGKIVVFRDIDEILHEIRNSQDFLFFINDDLYFHRDKVERILEGMTGMKKHWLGLGTADMARDDRFLKLMKKAGCWLLYLDFGPREARALNNPKRAPAVMKQLKDRLQRFKNNGIKIISSFTFGYDFDLPDIFDNTLDFCLNNKIDEAEFHLLVPYPGSRIAAKWEKEARILTRDWKHYTATEVVFKPKNMTSEQLYQGYRRAWTTFYQLPEFDDRSQLEIESFLAFPAEQPDKLTY